MFYIGFNFSYVHNSFITYTDLILLIHSFSRPDPTAGLVSIKNFISRSVTPRTCLCTSKRETSNERRIKLEPDPV